MAYLFKKPHGGTVDPLCHML